MEILKPQKKYFEKLQNKNLCDISHSEDIEYCYFENEDCNNIELWDFKFQYCKFNHVCMQQGKLEKITFIDVIFDNCNFSNTEFTECALLDVNLIIVNFLDVIYLKIDYIMFLF